MICRTCLKDVLPENCLQFPNTNSAFQEKIYQMINTCIPEMDLFMAINPVLCFNCVEALETAYIFRTTCLKIEDEIINYLCSEASNNTENGNQSVKINLSNLKQYMQQNNKNADIDTLFKKDGEIRDNTISLGEIVEFKQVNKEIKGEKQIEAIQIKEEFEEIDVVNEVKTEIFQAELSQREDTVADPLAKPRGFQKKGKYLSKFNASGCPGCKRRSSKPENHNKINSKFFSCGICKRYFDCVEDIRRHIYQHTLPYVCKICGKRSRDNNSLEVHLRSHVDHKPFICAICEKGFKQKYALTQHLRTHNPETSFKCEVCSRVLSCKYNLKVHMTIHTGKRFSCKYCRGTFLTNSMLTKHLKSCRYV